MKKYLILFFAVTYTLHLKADQLGIGLTVVDNVFIYSDSTTNASIIDELDFAESILTIGETGNSQPIFNRNGWIQVLLPDYETGWVRNENIAVASPVIYICAEGDTLFENPADSSTEFEILTERKPLFVQDVKLIAGALWLTVNYYANFKWVKAKIDQIQLETVYFDVISFFRGGWSYIVNFESTKDLGMALEFSQKLQHIVVPDDSVYYFEPMEGFHIVGSGAFALYSEYAIYNQMEEYDAAIEVLQKIVNNYSHQMLFSGNAGAWAMTEIAHIYHSDLENYDRAIEQYHLIIQTCEEYKLSGEEWWSWVDISAATGIVNILSEDANRLKIESEKIISETGNSTVIVVGYAGLARSYGLRKKYDKMVDTAIAALEKYPDEYRYYYLSTTHFSCYLASNVFQIFEDDFEYEKYISFGNKLQKKFKDYTLGAFSVLKVAFFCDKTIVDIQPLKELYNHVINDFDKFSIYDPAERENCSVYYAMKRIDDFREFIPRKATLKESNVEIRYGYSTDFPVIKTTDNNNSVSVLYGNSLLEDYLNEPSSFIKIKLADGTIGWVSAEKVNIETVPVFSDICNDCENWEMEFANSERNPVFSGETIEKPVLENVIQDYFLYYPLFFDMNGDQVSDFLVQEIKRLHNNTVIIDGKTLDILWRIDNSGDTFLADDDKLIINRNNHFSCYDLQNKQLAWDKYIKIARDKYYNPLPYKDELFVLSDDSTLLNINANNGDINWSVEVPSARKYLTAANEKAFVISSDKGTYAFNPEYGNLLWVTDEIRLPRNICLDKSYAYIYSGGYNNETNEILDFFISAVSLTEGEILWQNDFWGGSTPENLLAIDNKIALSYSRSIICFDKASGEKKWQEKIPFDAHSLIAVNDVIYASNGSSGESGILAFDMTNRKIKWHLKAPGSWSRVCYHAGKLFANGQTGIVIYGNDSTKAPGNELLTFKFDLLQNYPNPFNAATNIIYDIEEEQHVKLVIYNILGREVDVLVDRLQNRGRHIVTWNGKINNSNPVSSGVYFYRLFSSGKVKQKAMVFVK
ncbi:PQQ-binding-like beta-propeller repeat protein [candidate division KSB1 bacterium]|nr:PQQ-binding-like beta-propeller repeat protein [candidate division KSB1 bacterium]